MPQAAVPKATVAATTNPDAHRQSLQLPTLASVDRAEDWYPAPVLKFILGIAFLCTALPSCVRVKPYQRANLSKRSMTADKDASESRFEQHTRGSREGSDGGTGQAGGGCGCN